MFRIKEIHFPGHLFVLFLDAKYHEISLVIKQTKWVLLVQTVYLRHNLWTLSHVSIGNSIWSHFMNQHEIHLAQILPPFTDHFSSFSIYLVDRQTWCNNYIRTCTNCGLN